MGAKSKGRKEGKSWRGMKVEKMGRKRVFGEIGAGRGSVGREKKLIVTWVPA